MNNLLITIKNLLFMAKRKEKTILETLVDELRELFRDDPFTSISESEARYRVWQLINLILKKYGGNAK